MKWWEDRSELLSFARKLVDSDDLQSVGDLLYFLEKPWKWDTEHEAQVMLDMLSNAAKEGSQ